MEAMISHLHIVHWYGNIADYGQVLSLPLPTDDHTISVTVSESFYQNHTDKHLCAFLNLIFIFHCEYIAHFHYLFVH